MKRQLIPRPEPPSKEARPPRASLNLHEWSAWLQLLSTFTLLPAALDSQLRREVGISHFEFGVMAALSRQPKRSLQLKDLAVVANGSLSRLSHVISRLEERGWVRRTSGTKGSATDAQLTDEGYRKLMAAGPIHFREVRRLVFDVLTPEEVKAMRRVTSRINVNLLGGIDLGTLARQTRQRSLREASRPGSRPARSAASAPGKRSTAETKG